MKIALIGTAHPYRGGLAAYNEKLAAELQKEGHEVTIYTFTLQYPSILFPGKTQYSSEPAPTHLKIVRCVNSVNPLNWWSVGNKIKKEKPDLVLFKYWLPVMDPWFGTIVPCHCKFHKVHSDWSGTFPCHDKPYTVPNE